MKPLDIKDQLFRAYNNEFLMISLGIASLVFIFPSLDISIFNEWMNGKIIFNYHSIYEKVWNQIIETYTLIS
jgi:hypothetical protein